MTIEVSALLTLIALIFKAVLSLNALENIVVKLDTKVEYLEKHLSKLDDQITYECRLTNRTDYDNNNQLK